MTMETNVLTLPIADSASTTRAPAVLAESAASLRADLAAAIQDRRAAEARHAEAAKIAARADEAKIVAAMEVEQIKQGLDDKQAEATREHAQALTAAFRAGSPLPGSPALPQSDSAHLSVALASLRALQQSACELATEANAAQSAAADAARACRDLADRIVAADAKALALEWIATVRLGWELQDKLVGLARLGGDFLPVGFQSDLLEQVDRRKAAVMEHGDLMRERHRYDAHLNGLSQDQEDRWLSYRRRLMESSDATFDGDPPQ